MTVYVGVRPLNVVQLICKRLCFVFTYLLEATLNIEDAASVHGQSAKPKGMGADVQKF